MKRKITRSTLTDINDLLPIGSVVLLKEGEKRLMIIGIMQRDAGRFGIGKKDCDYLGVFYPEGYLGKEHQYLFNHEDIEKIFFRGYEDDDRKNFLTELSSWFEEQKM